MLFKVICVVVLLSASTQGLKILGLFPHPSISHVAVFYPLVKGLAEKGHEVTFVSYFEFPDKIPTLKQKKIQTSDTDLRGSIDLSFFNGYRIEKYLNPVLVGYIGIKACYEGLSTPVFKELLNSKETYDIVLLEFFNTDCFTPFAYKFQAHLIGLSSCTIMPWSNEKVGNLWTPSYIPDNSLPFDNRMSFLQRVENTAFTLFDQFLFNYILRYVDEKIARNYFQEDFPTITEIVRNSSLFLVNSHPSLTLPRPLVPQVVDIGGIHIGEVKPLQADLEKWISESPHGVIYFSLGSMIKGHTFPEEKRREFLKAFKRLPQRVLWKYENDSMPDKPDNVMIRKWMPQLDILCHPNVKAFISHGGLLGTTEAVHCGVPVVVMPQFGDQHTNAKALEASGGGVILQLNEATEEKVYDALKKVLDPEFRKSAKELSERFRDRPMPPLETAIYWVEYVARHRGAHHMRTAAVDMPLYQYLLLDVIAFIVLIAAIISAMLFYAIRRMFRKLFSKRDKLKTN